MSKSKAQQFIQTLLTDGQDTDTINEIATGIWFPKSHEGDHECFATVTCVEKGEGVHFLVKVIHEEDMVVVSSVQFDLVLKD